MPLFQTLLTALLSALLLNAPAHLEKSFAEEIHPVVVDYCLIGGTVNGKWVEPGLLAPKLKGGEKYRFYTLTKSAGESIGDKPKIMADYCSDTMEIKHTPEPTPEVVLAVAGNWNALPRVPQVLSNNDQVYRAAVADILRRKRFRQPRINITRVLRLDLEGDGPEETLVSASYYADGLGSDAGPSDAGPMAYRPKAGDYSFVFLRKLVRGKVRNIFVAGEFYPIVKEDTGPPSQYLVTAVGDVDGNGTMEFIVRSNYYEGGASTIYHLQRGQVTTMSGCGCGA